MEGSNKKITYKADWIERILDLPALLEKKSCFLLGPHQTGKTFLIHHLFKDVRV